MNQKIYVGNLSYTTTDDQFRDFFQQFGTIVEIKLIRDFETGRSKGFGFVTFSSDGEVNNALQANGQELDGRKLKVNIAQENSRTGGSGGRRPGGNGGKRFGGHHGGGNRRDSRD